MDGKVKQHFKKHWTKYVIGAALASQPQLSIPALAGAVGYKVMKSIEDESKNKKVKDANS